MQITKDLLEEPEKFKALIALEFSKRLFISRTNLKITQTELARRIGVNVPTIILYEKEGRLPSFATLIKIAFVLGVSADYLCGIEQDRECIL